MMISRRAMLQLATTGALLPHAARAETNTIRVGIQYGLTYLPFAVMQHEKLIEKHAKALGLGDVTVTWNRSAGGNVLNDALLAGTLDCVATGFPSFFVLWSRARGRQAIKALASYGSTPLLLVTRNPAVKTIADFTEASRITVPAVKSSVQAMLLQMAAEKQFGQYDRLDRLTTSRSHPDAIAAVLSMMGEIDSAFSAPPYQYQALGRPGIHVVTSSDEIFGGPLSNGALYMTEKFHDENPGAAKALNLALREALDIVTKDRRRAAEMYLAVTGEKMEVDAVLQTLAAPGTVFEAAPRGAMKLAAFMHKTGAMQKAPASWKELFFPEAYDLPGD